MMKSLNKFHLSSAEGLGLLRIIFFGYLFILYSQRNTELMLFDLSPEHWRATFWFEFFGIPRVSYQTAQWFWKVWILSLLLSSLGLFYRVSSLAAAFLGWFILNASASTAGDEFLWNYSNGLPVLWMLVFSVSKAHATFSLDKLIFKKSTSPDAFDSVWPLLLLRVLFVFPFFFSAVHRFVQHGTSLFQTDHLLNVVTVNYSGYCMNGASYKFCHIVAFFLEYPRLMSLLFDFSQIIEVCTVLILFSKFARWLILPGLIGMQIGIYFLLFENFLTFTPLYFVWLPIIGLEWKKLLRS